MKIILSLIGGLIAFHGVAQNDIVPPVEPFVPPVPPSVDVEVPAPPTPPGGSARNRKIRLIKSAAQDRAEAEEIAADVHVSTARDRIELDQALPRSTKTGRTLVIQTSNTDPDALTDAEEDLSVMALILRKATGGGHREDRRVALGIEVESTVFGSSSGARNLYVEGHGAIFLLTVPFPLIAPAENDQENAEKKDTSSDWAEAREEYLSGGQNRLEVKLGRTWTGGGRPFAERYDEAQVAHLKDSMIEALKNASHIRALKPEDHVTVVVQGAESLRPDKGGERTGSPRKSSRSDARRSETVLTIRVKKSDVDAFASGGLDADAFRKKAAIQTYFRRGDASVGTSFFFAPSTTTSR